MAAAHFVHLGNRSANRSPLGSADRCSGRNASDLFHSLLRAGRGTWPGPVIYYLTDLIAAYSETYPDLVRALDRRMCQAAKIVCPNSQRLADYLMSEAGCTANKIQILPNATGGWRASLQGTWESRATTMRIALDRAMSHVPAFSS